MHTGYGILEGPYGVFARIYDFEIELSFVVVDD